jgi:hypothetical protein
MKEMMIRLPVVEIAASDSSYLAKHYPKSGRYIVKRDNGDTSVVDVQLRPGEDRRDDEQATVCECFLGQPDLLDPDDWALAIDIENAKMAARANVENIKCEMADLKSAHENELADKERECQEMIEAAQAEARAVKEDFESRKAALQEQMDTTLAMRRMELDQEYELKKMQLELDTPKRFAQGEWVSGKTLTEIVKTLAGKKED